MHRDLPLFRFLLHNYSTDERVSNEVMCNANILRLYVIKKQVIRFRKSLSKRFTIENSSIEHRDDVFKQNVFLNSIIKSLTLVDKS